MAPVKKLINSVSPKLISVCVVLCSIMQCILLSAHGHDAAVTNDQCCITRSFTVFMLHLHHSGHFLKGLTVAVHVARESRKRTRI